MWGSKGQTGQDDGGGEGGIKALGKERVSLNDGEDNGLVS